MRIDHADHRLVHLIACIVAVADLIYQTDLGLTNNVVPLLSVVVGLLLVFRNSTAYARWQEGRQLFSNMYGMIVH